MPGTQAPRHQDHGTGFGDPRSPATRNLDPGAQEPRNTGEPGPGNQEPRDAASALECLYVAIACGMSWDAYRCRETGVGIRVPAHFWPAWTALSRPSSRCRRGTTNPIELTPASFGQHAPLHHHCACIRHLGDVRAGMPFAVDRQASASSWQLILGLLGRPCVAHPAVAGAAPK